MVRGGEKNSSPRYLISSASSDASPLQSFSTVHSWIMTSGKSERSATAARSDRGGLFTGVGLIVALIGVESVILSIPSRYILLVIGVDLRLNFAGHLRSEEHTSELQSLMRISYAVFCLKKKQQQENHTY